MGAATIVDLTAASKVFLETLGGPDGSSIYQTFLEKSV